MDRRSLLKYLTFGVLGGAAAQADQALAALPALPEIAPRSSQEWYESSDRRDLVLYAADEVEEFFHAARKLSAGFPSAGAVSLPFASHPVNCYVRFGVELRRHVEEPNLGDLARLVRRGYGHRALEDIMKELWRRYRPACYYEQEDHPTKLLIDPEQPAAPLRMLSSRVTTPKNVIDLDELDGYTLATLLCVPLLLRQEILIKGATATRSIQEAYSGQALEGDGWMSPLGVYIDQKAYMLELFCYVSLAGVVYSVEQLTSEAQEVLAERRKSPWHWTEIPFDPAYTVDSDSFLNKQEA